MNGIRHRSIRIAVALLLSIGLAASGVACSNSMKEPVRPPTPQVLETRTGNAVFYSRSLNGSRSADGGRVDNSKLTAAHHTYPFGTIVKVTRLANGKSVQVRITDHLPMTATNRRLGIVIDLTRAAASELDMIKAGRTKVKVEVLSWGSRKQRK
jgi:rare lipoprotein A